MLVALTLALSAVPQDAQPWLTVEVRDATTQRPIEGASVRSEADWYSICRGGAAGIDSRMAHTFVDSSLPLQGTDAEGRMTLAWDRGWPVDAPVCEELVTIAADGYWRAQVTAPRGGGKLSVELLRAATVVGRAQGLGPDTTALLRFRARMQGARRPSSIYTARPGFKVGTFEARLDEQGRFVLNGLPPRHTGLLLELRNDDGTLAIETQRLPLLRPGETHEIEFPARDPNFLEGRIFDRDGQPAANAKVAWMPASPIADPARLGELEDGLQLLQADGDGHFSIALGLERAAHVGPWPAPDQEVVLLLFDAGAASEEIEIRPTPRASVVGQIALPDGSPAVRATAVAEGHWGRRTARSDSSGLFRIEDVPDTPEVRVHARLRVDGGWWRSHKVPLDDDGGPLGLTVGEPEPEPTGSIRLRLLGVDADFRKDCAFVLRPRDPAAESRDGFVVDAWRRDTIDGLTPGRYDLAVATMNLEAVLFPDVEVRARRASRVSGAPEPTGSLRLDLSDDSEWGSPVDIEVSRRGGVIAVVDVWPGVDELVALPPGPWTCRWQDHSGEAQVREVEVVVGRTTELTVAPPRPLDFYVDPLHGSASGRGTADDPWRTIEEVLAAGLVESRQWNAKPYAEGKSALVPVNEGAPVGAGATLWLRDGDHGALDLTGLYNDVPIRIAAEPGHTPRLTRIAVRGGARWTFEGLSVSPSHGEAPKKEACVSILSHSFHGPAREFVVKDCRLFSARDVDAWTQRDWRERAVDGVDLAASDSEVSGCTLEGVYMGISTSGERCRIVGNTVDRFGGDGARVLGSHTLFEGNVVRNSVWCDENENGREDGGDNHDDLFQSWTRGSKGVGTGVVSNVVVRGNLLVARDDPELRFPSTPQGIGGFDGTFSGWRVENNVVVVDHWHGITLLGAQDCELVNNTVLDLDGAEGAGPARIWIAAHKDGTPSSGVLIRNNLVSDLVAEGDELTVDHNLIVTPRDLRAWFLAPEALDFRLRLGAGAVDAGIADRAPADDHGGTARPQGEGVDVGAFER